MLLVLKAQVQVQISTFPLFEEVKHHALVTSLLYAGA